MNLFVLGWSGDGGADPTVGRRALVDLLERLHFLAPERVESWRAPSGHLAAAWVSHPAGECGGVRYTHVEPERMALFSGRPYLWTGEREADGRAPLDPRLYLRPAGEWAEALDGRYVAAAYRGEREGLELYTDPLGAYPVFTTEAAGMRWYSGSAEALRVVRGGRELARGPLAGLLGGGWPLSGNAMWRGVERVPRASVIGHRPGRPAERRDLLPVDRIARLAGAGSDAAEAAEVLVAGVRALSDWPGRPSFVPVTGGRDSRLVLAAALRAGIDFTAVTGGPPDSPDVRVARRLCEAAGVPHELLGADPHGDMYGEPLRAARIVRLGAGGTATLADAAGFPLGPRGGPLPLWHSGQGGEIARAYYGTGEGLDRDGLVDRLYRRFVGRRPGRREILSREGEAIVRADLGGWVDEQLAAGAAPTDVPDLFYLLGRMGTWAGPTHGCVEWVRDTTSPLWSRRLLHHELGPPAAARAAEAFHRRVLDALAPELARVPFEDGSSWASDPRPGSHRARRARRGRELAVKAAGELRRRVAARLPERSRGGRAPGPPDPLAAVMNAVREEALAQPGHEAWHVLDRARVERLLASHPAGLDAMSRYYVWRLATVFLDGEI